MDYERMISTPEEKEMLMVGLTRVMYADGILTDTEEMFIKKLAVGLNLDNYNVSKEYAEDKNIKFNDTETCMYFLTQAVQLCYIDGSYDQIERKELLKICGEMGISEEALLKVEEWVEEGIEWNNRGMELLKLK